MEGKKDVIYISSKEALIKIFVLVLTIGISVLASMLDYKSCYVTILVQACNNMYDFYQYTDNKKYVTIVRRESIAIIFFSIIAIFFERSCFFAVIAHISPDAPPPIIIASYIFFFSIL